MLVNVINMTILFFFNYLEPIQEYLKKKKKTLMWFCTMYVQNSSTLLNVYSDELLVPSRRPLQVIRLAFQHYTGWTGQLEQSPFEKKYR